MMSLVTLFGTCKQLDFGYYLGIEAREGQKGPL